ncbi:peptide ligase PGM1-related protein [Paenarthrobacter nicotinovorans]|uniref:peptide ligase PGM1-related protein n=1 Tax=Paenarthrobacter nicotinovorans TaxID=29320 RepID=UPI003D675302
MPRSISPQVIKPSGMRRTLLVVLYAVDFDETVHSRYPEIGNFTERGLFHLSRLKDVGTEIVFIANGPVDSAVIDYHLGYVMSFKAAAAVHARERLHIRTPRHLLDSGLSSSVLRDVELLNDLKHLAESADHVELLIYGSDPNTDAIGRVLGIRPSEGPSTVADTWGNKSGSKRAFERAGIRTPATSKLPVHSREELIEAAQDLFTDRCTAVIAKIDSTQFGSGIGNIVLNQDLFSPDSLPSVLDRLLEVDDFRKNMELHGVVVQEYISEVHRNLGIFGTIDSLGAVRLGPCYEQTSPEVNFGGAISGHLTSELCSSIRQATQKVGDLLYEEGYAGCFGIDFVEDRFGRLYALEINVRKVGSYHPFAFVDIALSRSTDPERSADPITSGSVVIFRQMTVPSPGLLSIDSLLSTLRNSGLLFSRKTGRGVILHILGAVPAFGLLEATCIGDNVSDAMDQLSSMQRLLDQGPARQARPSEKASQEDFAQSSLR